MPTILTHYGYGLPIAALRSLERQTMLHRSLVGPEGSKNLGESSILENIQH